jgi:hypothetical protein
MPTACTAETNQKKASIVTNHFLRKYFFCRRLTPFVSNPNGEKKERKKGKEKGGNIKEKIRKGNKKGS